jgi:endoglucanase
MKLKKIMSMMLLAAAVLGFQSCSDSDSGGSMSKNDFTADGTVLTLSHDGAIVQELNLSMGELTSYMISVNSDGGWKASVPANDTSWVHITPHEGYGWAVSDTTVTNTKAYVKLTVDYNEGEARSSAVTFTTGGLSAVLTINQAGRGSSTDPIESAWDMVANLKLGYNLGNTLDANPWGDWWDPSTKTIADWETSWGQPLTTQEIIDGIAEKGINIIRVPVTWYPHMDANDNVSEEWMARVEEVVNYVLKANCYCILNIQHDNGAADGRTDGGAWLYADMDDYPALTVRYQKLWTQIATRFKDYDGKLIFESFNEILNKSYSWTAPSAVSDGAYEAINKLQQDFVNVVRATGGNNLYRNLAVTTYAATGTSDTALEALQLPQDKVSNHLYLSIHSYDPYNFCNNNAGKNDDGSEYDYNIKIFDDDCKAVIDGVFSRVSKRATNMGVPFIFGEFGAIDEEKSMAERVKYANYLNQKFKEFKTSGLWWMGLFNRKTLTWYEEDIVNALLK